MTDPKQALKNETPETPPKESPSPKIFAQGYCFVKIFAFFLLGSVIGTYYEQILWYIRFQVWVPRQGVFYGPFSPIYGVGFSIFVIFLGRGTEKRSWLRTWAWSALIGGCTEYGISLFAEKVFGATIWDYHENFLNINGRTTIPFMIFWGIGGMVLMKLVYPFVSKWLEKVPYKVGQTVFLIVLVLMIADIGVSYGALARRTMRDQGQEPMTVIGQWFDRVYPDEYIDKKIPAMVFDKNEK